MSDESNVLIVSHADRGGRIRIIRAQAARLITELNTIP
jgi:hypothetical protein